MIKTSSKPGPAATEGRVDDVLTVHFMKEAAAKGYSLSALVEAQATQRAGGHALRRPASTHSKQPDTVPGIVG